MIELRLRWKRAAWFMLGDAAPLPLFFVGGAAIVLQVALGAMLAAYAPSIVFVAAAFLMGVPLGIALTRPAPALAFPAMGLLALAGVAPVFFVDVAFFGRIHDLSAAKEIATGAGVAGYVAPGWRIETERALQERLSGKRKGYGHRRIAPLRPEGQGADMPVRVWAMGELRDSGRVLPWHPRLWSAPEGEYARLVGAQLSGAQLAAGRAAETFGLAADPDPLIVLRVESVDQAMMRQYWALARLTLYAWSAWTAVLILAAAARRWAERD